MNKHIVLLVAGLIDAGSSFAADVVVIVNASAAAPGKEQLADIYLGRTSAFTPLDQSEALPIRFEFYRKARGRDLAQVKSVWSRIAFAQGLAAQGIGRSSRHEGRRCRRPEGHRLHRQVGP